MGELHELILRDGIEAARLRADTKTQRHAVEAAAQLLAEEENRLGITHAGFGRGRVARPFGSALTDPGRRLSRTRLFPEVTRIKPHVVSMGE